MSKNLTTAVAGPITSGPDLSATATLNTVQISHGANDITLDVAGYSVAKVQRAAAQTLNVPPDAIAFVNGKQVQGGHVLRPGDTLEFLIERGGKGVGKVWTKAEFMELFHMGEADWQDWVNRGLPVDTMDDGTIVLNETEVDNWKRANRLNVPGQIPNCHHAPGLTDMLPLSPTEELILGSIKPNEVLTGREIGQRTKLTTPSAYKGTLARLQLRGLVRHQGRGYVLTDEGLGLSLGLQQSNAR